MPASPDDDPRPDGNAPSREVHVGDAMPWMRRRQALAGACVITSLPDVSELRLPLVKWRTWFLEAAGLCLNLVPDTGAVVFFQTDIRHEGTWVAKDGLILRAAEAAGAVVLFHKIVCRFQPGHVTAPNVGYTHLIAVSRSARSTGEPGLPDVLVDPGRRPWVRAMGLRAAGGAVRFARDQLGATTVIDPFCGVGTVLAAANALGLHAIGVELSPRRSEQARLLTVALSEL